MYPLVFLKRKALLLLPLKAFVKRLVDTGEKSPIAAAATAWLRAVDQSDHKKETQQPFQEQKDSGQRAAGHAPVGDCYPPVPGTSQGRYK